MTAWDDIAAVAKPRVDQLEADLAAANLKASEQADAATLAKNQLNDANLKLAAALARLKELETPTATHTTLFGTCAGAGSGGTSLAAVTAAVTKWGKGIAVRLFLTPLSTAAPRDPNVGVMHVSWKPTNEAAITDAAVTGACKNLKAGDFVEVWHEMDSKDRKNTLDPTAALAMKAKFHDAVKRVRPDLNTIHTLTGWLFQPSAGLDPEKYVAKADYVGIDCDGIHPTKLPYTDYQEETKAVRAFVAKHGYKGYAVPEFGCPRMSVDPDGLERAKWMSFYASLWKADPLCAYVACYEYNSTANNSLEKPAEIAMWKGYTA